MVMVFLRISLRTTYIIIRLLCSMLMLFKRMIVKMVLGQNHPVQREHTLILECSSPITSDESSAVTSVAVATADAVASSPNEITKTRFMCR